MTDIASPAPAPFIQLASVEIARFRRLSAVRVDIEPDTTILVGANNSGKTSVVTALRQFLAEKPQFGAYDLSVDQWPSLRTLGQYWEKLDKDPAIDEPAEDRWKEWLEALLACMPTLDLWFDLKSDRGLHYVFPFIPNLKFRTGWVGVRLRLEPASDAKGLQDLAWRYRESRKPAASYKNAKGAWPTDLLDFWLRNAETLRNVALYKLDSAKRQSPDSSKPSLQSLPAAPTKIDRASLDPLIRFDFVAAQRGLGSEEASGQVGNNPHSVGQFSNQVLRFTRQHLNPRGTTVNEHQQLLEAIAAAQESLDVQLNAVMKDTVQEVTQLGYPGVHDPDQMQVRTRIQTSDLLDHSTAIQYALGDHGHVPEHGIGLGFQNLQSLTYQLIGFRKERLKPKTGSPAAVHIVMVEEPEAHLHVQVQCNFPRKALTTLRPSGGQHGHLATQLMLSTHASHLAHAVPFTHLRYLRRIRSTGAMATTEVLSLSGVFGTDVQTRLFAERYFQVNHTDLLFADGAILVEGAAERMLVPLFIEREIPKLRSRFLSVVDIGGSHAHRLKPLIEKLGIPTVVITDLDPLKAETTEGGETVYAAAPVTGDGSSYTCGNDTLTKWHPKRNSIADFANPKTEDLVWNSGAGVEVRFGWQQPIGPERHWPSSFEDAFILTNLKWFSDKERLKGKSKETGAVAKAIRTVATAPAKDLGNELHSMIHKSFNKGDFAATIFERMTAQPGPEPALLCPSYMRDALEWLSAQVNPEGTP